MAPRIMFSNIRTSLKHVQKTAELATVGLAAPLLALEPEGPLRFSPPPASEPQELA